MQYMRLPKFVLGRSSPSTKILMTLFLLSVAIGLFVALLQYGDRAGIGATGSVEWILGNEGDLEATEFKSPKSYRELLSITHDHAFSLPLLLFVLLHLIALTNLSERSKIALHLIGFGSLFGSLAGPWLIAYVSPGWNVLMRICGIGMCATMAVCVIVGLDAIWLAPGRAMRAEGQADESYPRHRGPTD